MLKLKYYDRSNKSKHGEAWKNCVMCGSNSRHHPKSNMVKFRGKWYCQHHFEFRWRKELGDTRLDIKEDLRWKE